jgi:hypothetical protein
MTAPCRVHVAGSRAIHDAARVSRYLDAYARTRAITEILHGGAEGVDTLAGQWARGHGIPVRVMRPDFGRFPVAKQAFTQRDRALVDAADEVVCIWDGESRGTRLVKEYAAKCGKLRATFLCKREEEEEGPAAKLRRFLVTKDLK